MVDHIKPMHDGGESLDSSNLQTLCNACHARKRGQEGAAKTNSQRGKKVFGYSFSRG
jgi:5-methylcytosine-specific restriction endonuclease McrA